MVPEEVTIRLLDAKRRLTEVSHLLEDFSGALVTLQNTIRILEDRLEEVQLQPVGPRETIRLGTTRL